MGLNYQFLVRNQLLLSLLVLESSHGPKGATDGQVLAIFGPHVVLGVHG